MATITHTPKQTNELVCGCAVAAAILSIETRMKSSRTVVETLINQMSQRMISAETKIGRMVDVSPSMNRMFKTLLFSIPPESDISNFGTSSATSS